MTSPRERGADLARFYTVTEPQRHPRGYTVYKVTARVSAGVRRGWYLELGGEGLRWGPWRGGAWPRSEPRVGLGAPGAGRASEGGLGEGWGALRVGCSGLHPGRLRSRPRSRWGRD